MVAILLAGSALALVLLGPESARSPTTIQLRIVVTQFALEVEQMDGHEEEEAEVHVFYPAVIIIGVGDTVKVQFINLDHHAHSLAIFQFGVDTGRVAPSEAREFTFTADSAGLYEFRCTIPYNPDTEDCAPDHNAIVGYIIVQG